MEENKTIVNKEETQSNNGELKDAIKETIEEIQTRSMLIGAQSLCRIIVQKIYDFESSYGKKSANDYKRLIKNIKKFCETGLTNDIDASDTNTQDTVQN